MQKTLVPQVCPPRAIPEKSVFFDPYTYIHIYICMYIFICIHIYICIYICKYIIYEHRLRSSNPPTFILLIFYNDFLQRSVFQRWVFHRFEVSASQMRSAVGIPGAVACRCRVASNGPFGYPLQYFNVACITTNNYMTIYIYIFTVY
jgi:hypothetical protein